jgi:hypothetical protein
MYNLFVQDLETVKKASYRGHHGKLLERRLFLLILDNLAVDLSFLTLQDKHNICTLSENIKFICTRCETGLKNLPKVRFFNRFEILYK